MVWENVRGSGGPWKDLNRHWAKGQACEAVQEAATQPQVIQTTDQTCESDQEALLTYLQTNQVTLWGYPAALSYSRKYS